MVKIDKNSNIPYYIQLKNQFKDLISSGLLKADTKLPPTRQLADNLEINRNTVLTAYEELEAEGFVCSHVGQGTFVSDLHEYVNNRQKPNFKKFNWSNVLSSEIAQYIR